MRVFLYAYDLRRPTVKQSCSVQDEDAADLVCRLAWKAEEKGGHVGEKAGPTEFLQLYDGNIWIGIR